MDIKIFEKENKDERIQIRVTLSQKEMVSKLAKKAGYDNVSEYTMSLYEKDFKQQMSKK